MVAEELNITRAAERLFITQQTLSGHIAALEQELGGGDLQWLQEQIRQMTERRALLQQAIADAQSRLEQIRKDMIELVIKPTVPAHLLDENTKIYVNPTGRFVVGGPQGDSGLTGRKIIVDTYGGYARHGGGAFSGKDPTKVDRTGAYYSRYIAKNLVAAGLADKCELQLAYAIGVAQPVSVLVDTFGTGKLSDIQLADIVRKHFDMRPAAMIEELELRKPVYQQVAAYGHMGREDLGVAWERTNRVEELKAAVAE